MISIEVLAIRLKTWLLQAWYIYRKQTPCDPNILSILVEFSIHLHSWYHSYTDRPNRWNYMDNTAVDWPKRCIERSLRILRYLCMSENRKFSGSQIYSDDSLTYYLKGNRIPITFCMIIFHRLRDFMSQYGYSHVLGSHSYESGEFERAEGYLRSALPIYTFSSYEPTIQVRLWFMLGCVLGSKVIDKTI